MIADRQSNFDVKSTITGDKVQMGIDQAAMAHIMNVLTDLYSDPELAVIREYSTNALDAHAEAGTQQPIEVTLPSPLSPFFSVKDFGIGLSVEDIHEIYSQYGNSTKRATNDQVGMLGLGCKSALTYTDQFTVTSIKDGTRIQVAVSRDEDGSGSMTVVDTSSTDEPNGTEIVVPARKGNTFETKAQDFFRFWKPGTVLVNGKAPESFHGFKVTDNVYVVEADENLVVMGNVAYPAPGLDCGLRGWNHAVVAFVDIGDVNFTPSREALMETTRTKQTLAQIEDDFNAGITGALQREIDSAATKPEAIRIMADWQKILPPNALGGAYTYGGAAIPEGIITSSTDTFFHSPVNSYIMSRHQQVNKFNIEAFPHTLFVVNYSRQTYTANVRKKLNAWMGNSGLTKNEISSFVLLPDNPSIVSEWATEDRIVEWDTVNAIKLVAATTRSGRIPGSYDMFLPGDDCMSHGIPANDIDQAKPVYYFSGDKWSARPWAQAVVAGGTDATIVVMPSTRVAKFCRNFPKAKNVRDVLKASYDLWLAKLSKDERMALVIRDAGDKKSLSRLDASKVDDPAIVQAVKWAALDVDTLAAQRAAFRGLLADALHEDWTNPLDEYPLFDQYGYWVEDSRTAEHIYLYLNAAYHADNDKRKD